MHFVTRSSDGRIAAIAEFIKNGNNNETIGSIERDLSKHNNKIQSIQSLTPLNMNKYYHYLGSLTTPHSQKM
ncbi:carbonic anhydrase family protein [Ligilactobacillus sp. LYQ135]